MNTTKLCALKYLALSGKDRRYLANQVSSTTINMLSELVDDLIISLGVSEQQLRQLVNSENIIRVEPGVGGKNELKIWHALSERLKDDPDNSPKLLLSSMLKIVSER